MEKFLFYFFLDIIMCLIKNTLYTDMFKHYIILDKEKNVERFLNFWRM